MASTPPTLSTIRTHLSALGTGWDANTVPDLIALYEPLQAIQNTKYAATVTQTTRKYGPHDRHRIDIYSPTSPPSSTPLPVIVYIHGGAYVGGDSQVTPNIYKNVGSYFASKGFVVGCITYRLAFQGAHFPDGAEDVRDALKWTRENIGEFGGDAGRVVAMGQSAGGSHLASALFMGLLGGNGEREGLVKGVVLLSAAFGNDPDGEMGPILREYFQTEDKRELATRWSPGALFKQEFFGSRERKGRGELGCKVLTLWGEWEFGGILDGGLEWVADYRRVFRRLPEVGVLMGHNHVSYCFGLGLEGEEYERVGRRLIEFVKEVTA